MAFSFLFNDICDVEKDRADRRVKPLARGDLPMAVAVSLALVLAILFAVSLVDLESGVASWVSCFLGSICYSLVLKPNFPIVAAFLWTGCVALGVKLFFDLSVVGWAFAWIVVFGREIISDYRDLIPDSRSLARKTIAIRCGERTFALVIACYATVAVGGFLLGSRSIFASGLIGILGGIVVVAARASSRNTRSTIGLNILRIPLALTACF